MAGYPKDWKVEKIGNLVAIETGNKNTQDREDGGIFPFYVRSDKVERINCYTHDTEGVVTAGDGVGTGKIFHYAKGKFALHQRCYLMHQFDASLDSNYFYWFFKTYFYDRIALMTAKSSVDSVRREMIADMPIAYPASIEEQKRIAKALASIDNLIENLTRRIEKKRLVKHGVMQELLTGKKRLPGFTGKWKQVLLKEVGVFQKGHGINRSETHSGSIPAVRYGEIYTHHNDYVRKYNSFISEKVAANAVAVHRGDVIFAGSGETAEEIGKAVAIVDNGVYVGGDTIIFSPHDPDAPIFWGYLLNMPYVQHQKTLSAHGATIIHIRPEAIATLHICIPEPPEQSAIATVLANMDASIANLESKRSKYEVIKRGLMHDLLTGKVRV